MRYASLFRIPLAGVGFTEETRQLSGRQIKPSAEPAHFEIAAISIRGIAHKIFLRYAGQGIQ